MNSRKDHADCTFLFTCQYFDMIINQCGLVCILLFDMQIDGYCIDECWFFFWLQIAKSTHEAELDRVQREADYKCVLEEVEREKQQYGTCNSSIQSKVQQYTTARKDRQLTFLKYVENKRSKYFDDHIARKSISWK